MTAANPGLVAAKLVLLLAAAGQLLFQDRAAEFWACLALYLVATAAWIYLVMAVVRGAHRPRLLEVMALALALRVLAMPLAPSLTDDLYRYMHEGNLVLCGENPYAVAPKDIDESFRHPEYWQKINHKEVPAAYPPFTQLALALGVTIDHSPLGMKLLFGLCDLCIALVLWFWLQTLGRPPSLAIVHGYCPLMALEFAGEGHSDSLAVLLMLSALWLVARGGARVGRSLSGGAALALATASKLLPAVLLPYLWRQARWMWLPFLVVLAAVYAPFLHDNMLSGTAKYSGHWSGNASVFGVLYWLFDGLCGYLEGLGWKLGNAVYFPQNWAKVPIALFGLGLLWRAWRKRWPPEDVAFAFFAFFVACTPTLHPWYVAFLVPFIALRPSVWLLAFCGTVYLAYEPLPAFRAGGDWQESVWVKVVEYVPLYVGLWGVRGRVGRGEVGGGAG